MFFSKVKLKITSPNGKYIIKLFKGDITTPVETKPFDKNDENKGVLEFKVQESGKYSVEITYEVGGCVAACGEK